MLSRVFAGLAAAALLISAASFSAAADVDFNGDIRPILLDKCFQCHGPDADAREADLRLDTRDGLFGDGDGDAPIVPGRADESELIRRILSDDPDERMPPPDSKVTLRRNEIALLRNWVEQGARWSRHWSLEPVRRPVLPNVSKPDWCRNGIDRFVLARLDREGLAPSPEASRETVIRRVTLDLPGLPPTPKEVDAFLADKSPKAFEKVVDRLLKSQRYGEHMTWFWLDAARYADSDGYESDPLRNMWPWRDWVVEAFNANMPYDRFLIEQLAGDLLGDADLRTRLATGFNRNHRLNNEGGILPEEWLVEYVCDRAETTATVFMGLTWGCARCHDHKYDPITQVDYYRLFAFFHKIPEKGSARGSTNAEPMLQVPRLEHLREFEALQKKLVPLNAQLDERSKSAQFQERYAKWLGGLATAEKPELPEKLAKVPVEKWDAKQKAEARQFYLTQVDPQAAKLEQQIVPLRKRQNELARTGAKVMVMAEMPQPRQTHILIRGAYNRPGEKVEAGTPAWLPPMGESLPRNRLGLARWLVDPGHPLTSRVAVNRFWEQFFGRGLVKTQENFGSRGEPPSHPELLDWLAWTFMESGWDVKDLLKRIVTSSTYRQSSAVRGANDSAASDKRGRSSYETDPDNRLLARGPRFRLPAAAIRDQALAAGGLLVDGMGGPPVKPYQPDGLWREVIKGSPTYKRDSGTKLYRRSLYSLWRRAVKPPLMMLLDANERDTCRVTQRRTNTPLQALLLLNAVTFVEAARGLATRMLREGGDSAADRIRYGMKLVTARTPTDDELAILADELASYLQSYRGKSDSAQALISIGESQPDDQLAVAELAAYTALARILINLDETVTKE